MLEYRNQNLTKQVEPKEHEIQRQHAEIIKMGQDFEMLAKQKEALKQQMEEAKVLRLALVMTSSGGRAVLTHSPSACSSSTSRARRNFAPCSER